MSKIKNIIIFVGIGAAFVLIYIFFIKPSPSQDTLVSSPSASLPNMNGSSLDINVLNANSLVTKDFLTLLLNVKNIKLDDSIFSDPAFNNLHDSSITLIPDSTEGRPNPFAQFGNDNVPTPPTTPITPTPPTTPANNGPTPIPPKL